jgi:hypothetical protein
VELQKQLLEVRQEVEAYRQLLSVYEQKMWSLEMQANSGGSTGVGQTLGQDPSSTRKTQPTKVRIPVSYRFELIRKRSRKKA